MKQSLLSRKLLKTGKIEKLSVISRMADGTYCVKPFEVETANTIFCDETLVLTSQNPAAIPFDELNIMNYDELLHFFLDFTADDNPDECRYMISIMPGDVKEIEL